jgi:UDP-glucuronate 4-epimerase
VIDLLGRALGVTPSVVLGRLSPGEAHRTAADVSRASGTFGYRPEVSIEEGVTRWVEWSRNGAEAPKKG